LLLEKGIISDYFIYHSSSSAEVRRQPESFYGYDNTLFKIEEHQERYWFTEPDDVLINKIQTLLLLA
jgi:hypothetical protein